MKIEEIILAKKLAGGSSPSVEIEQLNATENGTYSEQGKAYSPVIVEVPEPTLISKSITANGTYSASADNADGYSSVTVAVDGFKKKSIANTPTDIASFNDGTANPMPSLEISIEPVQSGSGDPSPSNVRPISGWSGANVTRCGKNLFDYTKITAVLAGAIGNRNGTLFNKVGTYSVNAVNGGNYMYARVFNSDGSVKSTYNVVVSRTITPATFTISSGEWFIVYDANPNTLDASKGLFENWQVQVELSNQPTTYFPYQGSTLSVPFHDNSDNPVTVYGGTLNETSGELAVTHANIASYNGETINEPWISSMDVYSAGATPTTGAQVVYPLATPQTYQLTPTQVSTLLGQNNIFADCGQVLEGEYFVTL